MMLGAGQLPLHQPTPLLAAYFGKHLFPHASPTFRAGKPFLYSGFLKRTLKVNVRVLFLPSEGSSTVGYCTAHCKGFSQTYFHMPHA